MRNYFALFALVVCMFWLVACAREEGELADGAVLVQVGEVEISAGQLRAFEAALPEHLRAEGAAAHREHAQSLVDRQLLLAEAEKRQLDRLPGLQYALADGVNERLAKALSAELVDAHLDIAEEELRRAYEEYELGWEVWPAHILSASEADARQVVRLLRQGAQFSEVARERSLAGDADKGGNLGAFFGQGDAVPALREATFHLDVGQISEPIQTVDGWEVVKILDKRRVPFESMVGEIAKQMQGRKWAAQRRQVVDELKEQWQVRYHGERAGLVLDLLRGASPTDAALAEPLISYQGGALSVGAAARGLRKIRKGALPPDSLALMQDIDMWILPDTLMVLRARAEGRDRDPKLLAWKENKRQELLISQLRVDAIGDRVEVGEEEIRPYYEQHLDTYRQLPGPIRMTEVLVDTRQEAERMLEKARGGEDLQALAARHSLRPRLEPVGGHVFGDSGRVFIESLYQSPYREFFGDSNDGDVGVLQGPMEVQGRWSVFRLDEPIIKAPLPFDQVRRPIRHALRKEREALLFAHFLDSLRTAWADQVRWREKNLARYSAR